MAQNGKSYATSADGVLREIHEGQILRTVSKNMFNNSKKIMIRNWPDDENFKILDVTGPYAW